MAPHAGSATPEQIEALLSFLDEHKDLARGRLRSIEAKVQAKRLWEELCNSLNSMGGCTKTVQQWQKLWFDRKHLAKKAAADCRRSASATGGGPSTAPQLTQWKLKVLSIMGDGFGERQTGARVPAFDEEIQLNPPDEPIEPTQQAEPSSQDSLTSQRSLPARFVRRRRQASGNSIGSRLLQIEEERKSRETLRNSELAGIQDALKELCRLQEEKKNELTEMKAAMLELCELIRKKT